MARDKFAVLYTRVTGTPRKLASMVMTSSELRVTKEPSAIADKLPGLSLVHDITGTFTNVYARDQWHHLPPQLEALLPPSKGDNPQRKILSKLLAAKIETRGMLPIEKEWEMLLFAGQNGVGHIDVFADDSEAALFYGRRGREVRKLTASDASGLWYAFRQIAEETARGEDEINEVINAVGPTPGISGFNPKLYISGLSMHEGNWTGELNTGSTLNAIVKVESTRYPGLLALEELAYEFHRSAELPCPRTWLRKVDFKGETFPILAIERFDRDDDGLPIPLESVFSILRTGAPRKFYDSTDGSMEDVWKAVAFCSTDLIADRTDLYKRFAMSLLTGNGDLHSENWAILGGHGASRLSPVYDPAPMRAYRAYGGNHDLISALPFSGIGGMADTPYSRETVTPPDIGEKLMAFGETIGIAPQACRDQLAALLENTAEYRERAISILEAIPSHRVKPNAPDIPGFAATLTEMHEFLWASVARKRGLVHVSEIELDPPQKSPSMGM